MNEGDSVWRIAFVSLAPVVWICRSVSTSTGTAFSASAPGAREPTVISSWKDRPSAKSSERPSARTSTSFDCGPQPEERDAELERLADRVGRQLDAVAAVAAGDLRQLQRGNLDGRARQREAVVACGDEALEDGRLRVRGGRGEQYGEEPDDS